MLVGSIKMSTESVDTLTHPDYDFRINDWEKFSLVMEGGRIFVNKYLQKFSARETDKDFTDRKNLTFAPTHAKSILTEIKNAIFQRMVDITRSDGPTSYQEAIKGENGGVNYEMDTMDSFIGNEVILSLLTYGKIGVFVDKPLQLGIPTRAETLSNHPYLYTYEAPAIRSWKYNNQNVLTHVLLHDVVDVIDNRTGLVTDRESRFRLLRLTEQGVEVRFFNEAGLPAPAVLDLLEIDTELPPTEDALILNLPRIPFVIAEISESLLQDIADYQIALLNLGSADINYAMKSNFPFYTEQYTPQSDLGGMVRQAGATGEDDQAQTANTKAVGTGVTQGRRYPKGVERPGFINPSSEPLKVSMEKQRELREEMRHLVNLALNSLRSRSAESKKEDSRGKEEGLSAIGIELETLERHIAAIWNLYETRGNGTPAVVVYPKNYSLKTDQERIDEADSLNQQIPKTPSNTLRKELSKESAEILVGHKVSADTMDKINTEIDAAPVIATDPEVIRMDAEAGLVGKETASKARGYPDGEVEKANVDHIDRLSRIAIAQSDAKTRGVDDLQGDPNSVRRAREGENETANEETTADKTRGKGQ
jgi:hypothetical protein